MTPNTRHIAIAGGGLAGLATAAYLARDGHRVTLFERSSTPGGRAATTEHAGYLHNMGPHALYPGGEGVAVLAELGVAYTGNRPDLAGVAVRRGRAFALPVGGRSLLTTRMFGVRARLEAGRQLLALPKTPADDTRTLAEWLATEFTQPAARDYASALGRVATYSNATEHVGLNDVARQFVRAGGGVLYIDGGWQTLVNGLRAIAEAAGATVVTGRRVESVVEGPRLGLRLVGGEIVDADAVVLAVPPAVARDLAPGSRALAAHAADAVPALAACLDIGLRRMPNPRRRFALGMDEPFYLSTHSLYARLAPEGRVLVSAAKYVPAGEEPDAARTLAELEGFLDVVQPGWRELEEHRQYLPNMVVQSAVPRADRGGIAGRPKPAVEELPGLFIAGDWVGDGGWLTDGTLGSAKRAAAAVAAWLAPEREPALAGAS